MGKAIGYVRLMRPVNSIMMGFAVLVGVTLAYPQVWSTISIDLFFGFMTAFMLTAASMTINDHYDRVIDAINEPTRPIPIGLVGSREALAFALVLTAVGFAVAYMISMFCLGVAVIAWLIFVTYTTVGKRTGLPGNFLVSICVAIPFMYGSIVATNSIKLNVLLFALTAFLSNTGREITKGIVDFKGDETQNVLTLAVRYGEKKAAIAATLFYFSAVLLSPLPRILEIVSFWYVPFVVLTDLGLIASSIMLLRDHSRENARRVKKYVLLWFVMGLLAYIAGVF